MTKLELWNYIRSQILEQFLIDIGLPPKFKREYFYYLMINDCSDDLEKYLNSFPQLRADFSTIPATDTSRYWNLISIEEYISQLTYYKESATQDLENTLKSISDKKEHIQKCNEDIEKYERLYWSFIKL